MEFLTSALPTKSMPAFHKQRIVNQTKVYLIKRRFQLHRLIQHEVHIRRLQWLIDCKCWLSRFAVNYSDDFNPNIWTTNKWCAFSSNQPVFKFISLLFLLLAPKNHGTVEHATRLITEQRLNGFAEQTRAARMRERQKNIFNSILPSSRLFQLAAGSQSFNQKNEKRKLIAGSRHCLGQGAKRVCWSQMNGLQVLPDGWR